MPLILEGRDKPSSTLRLVEAACCFGGLCSCFVGGLMLWHALTRVAMRNPRRALAQAQRAITLIAGVAAVTLSVAAACDQRIITIDGEPDSPYADLMRQHRLIVGAPACVCVLCVVLTPKNRGRIRRLIGEWGFEQVPPPYYRGAYRVCAASPDACASRPSRPRPSSSSCRQGELASTRSLAAISLLLGGGDGSQLESRVREAVGRFRSIPFSALRAEHFSSSDLTSRERFELVGARRAAVLHEVDAFVSHSWSDDGRTK